MKKKQTKKAYKAGLAALRDTIKKVEGPNFSERYRAATQSGGKMMRVVPWEEGVDRVRGENRVASFRTMVPISTAAKSCRVSVQTVHNYIVAEFLHRVMRPTPFKWLVDVDELKTLIASEKRDDFWTPERRGAFNKKLKQALKK